MAETGWLSDPIGRINNLSLAPSPKNTLQPMFEAVMNSIHAIEERFGSAHLSSGTIDIEMTENDEGSYTGFIITDNGIGLDTNNMISEALDQKRASTRLAQYEVDQAAG